MSPQAQAGRRAPSSLAPPSPQRARLSPTAVGLQPNLNPVPALVCIKQGSILVEIQETDLEISPFKFCNHKFLRPFRRRNLLTRKLTSSSTKTTSRDKTCTVHSSKCVLAPCQVWLNSHKQFSRSTAYLRYSKAGVGIDRPSKFLFSTSYLVPKCCVSTLRRSHTSSSTFRRERGYLATLQPSLNLQTPKVTRPQLLQEILGWPGTRH